MSFDPNNIPAIAKNAGLTEKHVQGFSSQAVETPLEFHKQNDSLLPSVELSSNKSGNNIIIDLLTEYFTEEKATAIALLSLSLVVNGIQAQGISRITAEIIQSIETVNRQRTTQVFIYLCIAFLAFLLLNSIYTNLQNRLLSKMRQWIRYRMLHILLESNKEYMDEINYPSISSPINRTSSVCFLLFSTIFNSILPDFGFIIIVAGFLLFTQPTLGILFIIGNLLIAYLIWFNWGMIFNKNMTAVELEYNNESHLLEVLHNFDKIVYRGQTENEANIFKDKSDDAFEKYLDFQVTLEKYGVYINFIVAVVVAIVLWFIIAAFYAKDVSITYVITALTMMILYRDKMTGVVHIIPDCVEFIGRTNTVLKYFKDISLDKVSRKFEKKDLPFHKIEFENVGFKYKVSSSDLVSGMSLSFNTSNHDIIGVTGLSGKGKSTIMKILLKMHSVKEGTVYIDGVNIDELSPDYIRENITYVSQNGKLFDRVVLENMMYGCLNPESCSAELQKVLKYPKIRDLFKSVDIENKKSGNLGENLSGGQRQVVNIIGGLINPSKILILDEPTNALDHALKWEVMRLIQDYSANKNAILIITHDKEMNEIFTDTVKI
jgi:ABC-type bacteriocin/lantibiotic exporter with double-glycine peptidase domain